jgi:hypothetical protein
LSFCTSVCPQVLEGPETDFGASLKRFTVYFFLAHASTANLTSASPPQVQALVDEGGDIGTLPQGAHCPRDVAAASELAAPSKISTSESKEEEGEDRNG